MKISIESIVKAPLNRVWDAWNNPADIKQWNSAQDDWHTTKSTVDLREGGKFMSEFGIRLALGARPAVVGGLVVGDGIRIIATGTIIGLVVALGVTRFMRALLYEVEPVSVVEFGLATGVLVVLALCATFVPAWRAARTHPAVVLRGE